MTLAWRFFKPPFVVVLWVAVVLMFMVGCAHSTTAHHPWGVHGCTLCRGVA